MLIINRIKASCYNEIKLDISVINKHGVIVKLKKYILMQLLWLDCADVQKEVSTIFEKNCLNNLHLT